MKIIVFLLLQLFLISIYSKCAEENEKQGSCTSCQQGKILVSGYCYQKMRGCLNYIVGPICQKCVSGYVLHEGSCLRSAVFYKIKQTQEVSPNVVEQTPTLTFKEIVDNLAIKYGSAASAAHTYLSEHHQKQIKGVFPTKVEQLQSRRQVLINMVYENYVSLVLKDRLNQIAEIYFYSSKIGNPNIITEIQDILKQQTQSENYAKYIFDISYEDNIFTFVYLGQDNEEALRISIQEYNGTVTENTQAKVQKLSKTDLALQAALKAHPYLQSYKVTQITTKKIQGEEIFIFQLSDKVQISVILKNDEFNVNSPFRINLPSQTEPLLGGFSQFTEFQDPRFISTVQFLKVEFKELKDYKIEKVYFQIVAGVNFLITFTNENNKIITKIHSSLSGSFKILSAQKDGQNIFTFNLQYNSDPYFLSSYIYFKKRAKLVSFPPIRSVFRKVEGSLYYYKITFTSQIFCEFTYENTLDQIVLISYSIGKQNILKLREQLLRVQRSPKSLMHFLLSTNPELVKNYRIRSVGYEDYIYKVIFVIEDGTYYSEIQDKGKMTLVSLQKQSQDNCFEITGQEIQKDQILSKIDSFLRTKYDISNFNLNLFQMKIEDNINKIRLVYSTNNLKQAQFYLDETTQTIQVIYAFILNYGYEVKNLNPLNKYDLQILQLGQFTLGQVIAPFFSETNGSHVKLFYKGRDTTFQVLINEESKKISKRVINYRSQLLYPTNFDPSNFISQSQFQEEPSFLLIKQKLLSLYSPYLKQIKVRFVEKTNNTYKILFKSQSTYFSILGQVLENQEINFGTLIVTSYKAGDFTSCTQLDSTFTKCLSCSQNQLQYQGCCHQILEGCLIQAGKLCIKCDSHYVFSDYKCLKSCSTFFI